MEIRDKTDAELLAEAAALIGGTIHDVIVIRKDAGRTIIVQKFDTTTEKMQDDARLSALTLSTKV